MEHPVTETHHQGHKNLISALQNPHYSPEDDNYKLILPVILDCDFFQRYFPTPDNLNEFAKLAKYSLTYEVHPYGTVLIKEKEYVDRFYIILQGDVLRFHQKPHSEVQKEVKEKRRRRSSIEKSSITRLSKVYRMSSESPTHFLTTSPNVINPIALNLFNVTKINHRTSQNNHKRASHRQSDMDSLSPNETKEAMRGSKRPSIFMGGSSERPQKSRILDEHHYEQERRPSLLERERAGHIENPLGHVQEEEGLIKYISNRNSEIKERCMVEGVIRVAKTKAFGTNSFFGENFSKPQQPKESSLYVVASSEVHLLTLTKENFKRIMKELEEQGDGKLQLFLTLFPSFDRDIVREFSEFFSEQCFQMNEMIYSQNEPTQDLYMVQSGEVKLYKDFEKTEPVEPMTPSKKVLVTLPLNRGSEIPVVSIIRSQLFGEERILKMPNRQYTAVAYHPNTTVYVLKAKLYKKVKMDFEFMFEALKTGAMERFAWREHKAQEIMEQQKSFMSMTLNQQSPKAFFAPHSRSNSIMGSPKSLGPHRGFSHAFHAFGFSEVAKNVSHSIDGESSEPSLSLRLEKKISSEENLQSPTQKLEHYKSHFSRKISLISAMNTGNSIINTRPSLLKTEHHQGEPVKDSFMEFSVRKELGDTFSKTQKMRPSKNLLQLNILTKGKSKARNNGGQGSLTSINSPMTPSSFTPGLTSGSFMPYTPHKMTEKYLFREDFKLDVKETPLAKEVRLPKINQRTRSELIGVVNISLEALTFSGSANKGLPAKKLKAKKFAPIHKLPFNKIVAS